MNCTHWVEYMSLNVTLGIKPRGMRSVGHMARVGKSGSACRVLEGKPSGKRPPGTPRLRWVDIKLDL
jgi:hypothetical protein